MMTNEGKSKMTNEQTTFDEEGFIYDQLSSAKEALAHAKHKKNLAEMDYKAAEKIYEETKQAAIDWMTGNGVVEGEYFVLRQTKRCVVPDANAVPDEWCRIKTVREPDKNRIKDELPEANWYTIETSYHAAIKADETNWK